MRRQGPTLPTASTLPIADSIADIPPVARGPESAFTSPGSSTKDSPVANPAKTRGNAAQAALLEELKAAAEKLGLRVREERLLREIGYRVRSGTVRLRENEVLLLDRDLSPGAQIDVLADELAPRATEDIYLSPAARALLDRAAAAKEARRHGRSEGVGR